MYKRCKICGRFFNTDNNKRACKSCEDEMLEVQQQLLNRDNSKLNNK